MRNAKKLLLLLLSIALLCGIFIVTALAEDGDASAEPANDYVSIVDIGLQPITTLKVGETIFNVVESITKEDGTTTELFYIGSEKNLYVGPAPKIGLVDASDKTKIEKWINPGETVTSDMLGRRIALIKSSADLKRVKAILWESDGVHYNFLATSAHPDDIIRQIFATALNDEKTETYMSGRKLTLYNNVTYDSAAGNALQGVKNTKSYVDLNGYTLTITNSSNLALYLSAGTLYLYSSQPGGKIVADAPAFFGSSGSAAPSYFGEDDDDTTDYAANFTVETPSFSQTSHVINILGGTYVQPEGATADYFLSQKGAGIIVKNATFIIKGKINGGFWGSHTGTILTYQDTPVTVICEAEEPINLAFDANNGEGTGTTKTTIFNAWDFYNVVPNVVENVKYSYSGCRFNTSYENPLASGIGRIAFDGTFVTKTVDGKEYTFGATMIAKDDTVLVHWGSDQWDFDIPAEYWAVGVQASHADVLVDGLFAYSFAPFDVVRGDDIYVTPTLKAVKPGTISMSLTLQSQIRMNLSFSEALNGKTITVKAPNGETITVDGSVEEGKRTCTYAAAPDVAKENVTVTIVIGENKHTVQVNVGSYASALLASTEEEYASARNLTYAMVEYVRVMANDPDFLKDVSVPTGYETLTPGENEATNKGTLLKNIAFKLDSTIALAIEGTDDAEVDVVGKVVTLELADRTLTATIDENKQAIFEGLYVNEFYGPLTLTVEGETYTYSIENYYNAIANKDAVKALYNYVEYANDYVEELRKKS